MIKLHPISCLDINNFDKFENISFTPNDCSVLYEKISEIFEDDDLEDYIDDFSPDNYFKTNKILTLDDTKEYEKFLKENLKFINEKNSEKMKSILNYFDKKIESNDNSFISLFNDCKKKKYFTNDFISY